MKNFDPLNIEVEELEEFEKLKKLLKTNNPLKAIKKIVDSITKKEAEIEKFKKYIDRRFKLVSAEEFMTDEHQIIHYGSVLTPTQALIEFAKIHCEAQQKTIIEKLIIDDYDYDKNMGYCPRVNEKSIIDAYPLDKIK